MTFNDLSVVIQAGGNSSRMGRDKGLVELAGKPMIQHVLDQVEGLADEVLITTNNLANFAQFNLKMASDEVAGAGALPGLQTALKATSAKYMLLLAVDMPFISRAVIDHLLELRFEANLIVPRWENRFQPMQAVYEREVVLSAVNTALAHNKKRMISFYDEIIIHTVDEETIRELDPTGLTFFNVNTPEDLEEATQIALLR